jgi:hypothetical protein
MTAGIACTWGAFVRVNGAYSGPRGGEDMMGKMGKMSRVFAARKKWEDPHQSKKGRHTFV